MKLDQALSKRLGWLLSGALVASVPFAYWLTRGTEQAPDTETPTAAKSIAVELATAEPALDQAQTPVTLHLPLTGESSHQPLASSTSTPRPVVGASASSAPPQLDETTQPDDAYLEELRQLWPQEPETALYLAERAESRLQASPGMAAECAWIAVRALLQLKRDPAAYDKSRQLVAAYPGTSWAADIRRHMFGGPPR